MKIWWCQVHKSSALTDSETRCHARYGIGCRMVPMLLIPADYSEDEKAQTVYEPSTQQMTDWRES